VTVAALLSKRARDVEERGERADRSEPDEPGVDRARSLFLRLLGGRLSEVVIGVAQSSLRSPGFLDKRRDRSLE
jgi:hypothetical protein